MSLTRRLFSIKKWLTQLSCHAVAQNVIMYKKNMHVQKIFSELEEKRPRVALSLHQRGDDTLWLEDAWPLWNSNILWSV